MNVVELKNVCGLIEQGKIYSAIRVENGNYIFLIESYEIGFYCENFVEEYLLEII
jgi:hypothetical protein